MNRRGGIETFSARSRPDRFALSITSVRHLRNFDHKIDIGATDSVSGTATSGPETAASCSAAGAAGCPGVLGHQQGPDDHGSPGTVVCVDPPPSGPRPFDPSPSAGAPPHRGGHAGSLPGFRVPEPAPVSRRSRALRSEACAQTS